MDTAIGATAEVSVFTYDPIKQGFDLVRKWSAFAVDDHSLVTNAHVVYHEKEDKKVENARYYYLVCITTHIEKSPQYCQVGLLQHYDQEYDIALLSVEQKRPQKLAISSVSPKIGDKIYAVGYPANGGDTITVTQGTINGKVDKMYKVDANLDQGNSGGPLINKYGTVVGLITSVSEWYSTLGYALERDYLNLYIAIHKNDRVLDSAYLDKFRDRVDATTKVIRGKKLDTEVVSVDRTKGKFEYVYSWSDVLDGSNLLTLKHKREAASQIWMSVFSLSEAEDYVVDKMYEENKENMEKVYPRIKEKQVKKNGYAWKAIWLVGKKKGNSFPLWYTEEYVVGDNIVKIFIYGDIRKNKKEFVDAVVRIKKNITLKSEPEETKWHKNLSAWYFDFGPIQIPRSYGVLVHSPASDVILSKGEYGERYLSLKKGAKHRTMDGILGTDPEDMLAYLTKYGGDLNNSEYLYLEDSFVHQLADKNNKAFCSYVVLYDDESEVNREAYQCVVLTHWDGGIQQRWFELWNRSRAITKEELIEFLDVLQTDPVSPSMRSKD